MAEEEPRPLTDEDINRVLPFEIWNAATFILSLRGNTERAFSHTDGEFEYRRTYKSENDQTKLKSIVQYALERGSASKVTLLVEDRLRYYYLTQHGIEALSHEGQVVSVADFSKRREVYHMVSQELKEVMKKPQVKPSA